MIPDAIDHHDQIASGAWANWLWLADPPSLQSALCLGYGAGAAQALSRRFDRVERASAEPEVLTQSWEVETFDLIALNTAEAAGNGVSPDTLWPVCVRLLRPGGCLALVTDNPLWYRRLPRVQSALAQVIRASRRDRSLRRAGFRAIHRYYMAPSACEPHCFIPANRHAVAGYERVAMKLSTRGTLRSRLGRAGLHPLLYPSTLHLAYR